MPQTRGKCSCACLTPKDPEKRANSSEKPRAQRRRQKTRIEKRILPALDKITEAELLKALLHPDSKRKRPRLHAMAKEEGIEKMNNVLVANVRAALSGYTDSRDTRVGKHHVGRWAKKLTKGLSASYKKKILEMTPSQVKNSQKKMTEADKQYFEQSYAPHVTRQKICELEIQGWLNLAEDKLEQKSGVTDKVVYFIRQDRMSFFWEKLYPYASEVYKWCWEQQPQFNYRPPKGRAESVFQRNMRVYHERGGQAGHIKTTPPSGLPGSDSYDCDEAENIADYVKVIGPNTIICRSPGTVWNILKKQRGKSG